MIAQEEECQWKLKHFKEVYERQSQIEKEKLLSMDTELLEALKENDDLQK